MNNSTKAALALTAFLGTCDVPTRLAEHGIDSTQTIVAALQAGTTRINGQICDTINDIKDSKGASILTMKDAYETGEKAQCFQNEEVKRAYIHALAEKLLTVPEYSFTSVSPRDIEEAVNWLDRVEDTTTTRPELLEKVLDWNDKNLTGDLSRRIFLKEDFELAIKTAHRLQKTDKEEELKGRYLTALVENNPYEVRKIEEVYQTLHSPTEVQTLTLLKAYIPKGEDAQTDLYGAEQRYLAFEELSAYVQRDPELKAYIIKMASDMYEEAQQLALIRHAGIAEVELYEALGNKYAVGNERALLAAINYEKAGDKKKSKQYFALHEGQETAKDQIFAEATRYEEDGDFVAAAEAFRRVGRTNATDRALENDKLAVEKFIDEEVYEQADAYFEVHKPSISSDSFFRLGTYFEARGDLEKALDYYKHIRNSRREDLENKKNDLEAKIKEGNEKRRTAALNSEDYDTAAALYIKEGMNYNEAWSAVLEEYKKTHSDQESCQLAMSKGLTPQTVCLEAAKSMAENGTDPSEVATFLEDRGAASEAIPYWGKAFQKAVAEEKPQAAISFGIKAGKPNEEIKPYLLAYAISKTAVDPQKALQDFKLNNELLKAYTEAYYDSHDKTDKLVAFYCANGREKEGLWLATKTEVVGGFGEILNNPGITLNGIDDYQREESRLGHLGEIATCLAN